MRLRLGGMLKAMELTPYQRKMAENEVIFRNHNEAMQAGMKQLVALANEENQTDIVRDIDNELYFYCECSDEKCKERILLRPSEYDKLHKTQKNFVIVIGHEVPSIERVIKKTPTYEVVEKYVTPPQSSGGLNRTTLHN